MILGIVAVAFRPIDNVPRYSCNDEINQIVIDYYDYFSTISLEEVRDYPIEIQRAISRTWSEDHSNDIWREKLNEDAKRFDGEKKRVILRIANTFDSPDFVAPTKAELLENFTEKEAYDIFLTLDQPDGSGEPPGGNGGNPPNQITVPADCECSTESDWCFGYCDGINCTAGTGCGFLWQYDCNGMCA